ncbi:hypothetical protein GCM10010435_25830 [Winogradskya consettensis]|uniref:Uncharacterized protein n=1 Tax=Winogradskya consettensis TaxID=113560 RepID=A0A919VLK8_9ACTN|nr:hypothetical protein [Actinoplanes consettensis]GIM67963.1 hypothetical protein Aco04nite_08620 [Actinoplanes consettensis]
MLLAGDPPQATAVVAAVKPRFSRVRVAAVAATTLDDPRLTGGRIGLGMIQTAEDSGSVRFSHFDARSV